MPSDLFTDAYLRSLKPKAAPYKRSERAPRGEGRLIVRVLPSGAKEFFYRQRAPEDKTIALGRYTGPGSLATIRRQCRKMRALQLEHGDAKEYRLADKRRRDADKLKGTLAQLCGVYVDAMKAAKKESAKRVEQIFRRNVTKPFPLLAKAKANAITSDDVRRILARMVRAGITRQTNLTRAYLHAAFEHAAKSDNDPRTVAQAGVLFALTVNPVAAVPIIKEYERTLERTLTEAELRELWKALEGAPLVQRSVLRFNLALACQRPTQLLRAEWPAFDFRENTLLLRDPKGRGGSRDHLLPLTEFALEQFKPVRDRNSLADHPFTADGSRAMTVETLSAAVAEVSKALAKSHGFPTFQLRDLRRTSETMLQKLGIDKEVRAHLLSHGRTRGVQGKHYERYDFLPEKRQALERWAAHLQRIIEGKPEQKVVALKASA
jgi:integrase